MATEIYTSIHINQPIEIVWKCLIDFANYPKWNPFITQASGLIREGEQLDIRAGGMHFRPRVLVCEAYETLEWKGQLIFPKLFDGMHRFHLEKVLTNQTLLHHSEKFEGLLVPFFQQKLKTETRRGFEAMNQALKKYVEN